jgi:hypothetical protein
LKPKKGTTTQRESGSLESLLLGPSEERGGKIAKFESVCKYGCAGIAKDDSVPVQCDKCESWFHRVCAGYSCDLLENPMRDGHVIELKAYCSECLEDEELLHTDVVAQQEEYAGLCRCFEQKANVWRWELVPQDGVSCFNVMWTKCPGKFDTLETFVSACALSALDHVDACESESSASKQRIKTVFKELAASPVRLSKMWDYLELQFLWHGVSSTVLPNVQLKLFGLEDQELRCVQAYPKDGGQREHVISFLHWNRKVCPRFDFILPKSVVEAVPPLEAVNAAAAAVVAAPLEDVVSGRLCDADGPALETLVAGGDPEASRKVPTVIAEANTDDKGDVSWEVVKAPPSNQEAKQRRVWRVGDVLEAEMTDPNFPRYLDTLHPVKVLAVLAEGGKYQCLLLAFESEDVWSADELHEPRDCDENAQWKKGDEVHIRIRNRCLPGVDDLLDGNAAEDGVWVKGVAAEQKGDARRICVEHNSWKDEGGRQCSVVALTNVRFANPRDVGQDNNEEDDDVCVFEKEVGRQRPFTSETERARVLSSRLKKAEWTSIAKNNTSLHSNVVEPVIAMLNSDNSTVLITGVGFEHALSPNVDKVTDLKAFLGQNDPEAMGKRWRERWTADLQFLLVPANIGNVHWCLLVVNLENGTVELWDSKRKPGEIRYPQLDLNRLQAFLRVFNPKTPRVTFSISQVPQQTGLNCGVFMLEFIRAFVNGHRDGTSVNVSEAQMSSFRAQIVKELKEQEQAAGSPCKKKRSKR